MSTLTGVEFDLGPCPADEMIAWTRMARRVIVEYKGLDEEETAISRDHLSHWSELVESWSDGAARAADQGTCFRWTRPMRTEVAEYLLHGLDQCIHSAHTARWVTIDEAERHRPVTMSVIQAFTNGLWAEGPACQHFADQVLSSLPIDA